MEGRGKPGQIGFRTPNLPIQPTNPNPGASNPSPSARNPSATAEILDYFLYCNDPNISRKATFEHFFVFLIDCVLTVCNTYSLTNQKFQKSLYSAIHISFKIKFSHKWKTLSKSLLHTYKEVILFS